MNVKDIGCPLVIGESLQSLIDKTIQEMFWEVAKIRLRRCECCDILPKDLCTVYTTFSGGYQIRFAFCAERTMMKRITENISEEPVTDPSDIEEYMKEFINVICGHVVASVFRKTKTSARFHAPCFTEGYYIPADDSGNDNTIITTHYTDEYAESASLSNDGFSFIAC